LSKIKLTNSKLDAAPSKGIGAAQLVEFDSSCQQQDEG
jgi:hypothetical protein